MSYCTLSKKGLILEANITAATLLGVPEGALVKQPFSSFIFKDDQDIFFLHCKQLFETGEPQACELRMVKKDGAIFWAQVESVAAKDSEDKPACRIVLIDVTERKQAEADQGKLQSLLSQAQKMESVGLLAGGVAHNLNNFLTGILGYIDLCRDELPPEHTLRPYLDEITCEANRSADLTRRLLAFSRKQTIVPKVLDLNAVVAGVLAHLRSMIDENIDVVSEPGKGTTFKIYFPRAASAAKSVPSVAPVQRPGSQTTILVVDDEKSVRITTVRFLEKLGYAVLAAESPEEALRLTAAHSVTIDLLLTDMCMPGMSGRQLSDQLLAARPHLKRIFMSGYTADELISRGDLTTEMHLLVKPFVRDVLERKVRAALDG